MNCVKDKKAIFAMKVKCYRIESINMLGVCFVIYISFRYQPLSRENIWVGLNPVDVHTFMSAVAMLHMVIVY